MQHWSHPVCSLVWLQMAWPNKPIDLAPHLIYQNAESKPICNKLWIYACNWYKKQYIKWYKKVAQSTNVYHSILMIMNHSMNNLIALAFCITKGCMAFELRCHFMQTTLCRLCGSENMHGVII